MRTQLLEVIATYKMGHQRFSTKCSMHYKNILKIEEVPIEIPEYTEGAVTRVVIASGEAMYCTNRYEDLISLWNELWNGDVL